MELSQDERARAPLVLAVAGYALWTLCEYWAHRTVFHFEPEEGLGERFHWMIHGVHHDHPNDPMRLVMPPAVSVPLAAAVFGVLYLVFGARYAPGLAVGFFAGYVVYDMLHYYLHHFRPHGRLGRMLRERHMRHHFQDETRGFGISAPYWDEVFGTSSRARTRSGGRRALAPERRAIAARAGKAVDVQASRGLDSVLASRDSRKEEEPWPPPTSTGS